VQNDGFSAKSHIATVADQGHFILGQHPNGSYEDIVETSYFVHGPGRDNVVRTLQSLLKFRGRFGPSLIEAIDQSRPAGNHTAGTKHLGYLAGLLPEQPAIKTQAA
jgi:hypothetical protein